ncbi:Isopenicillin N epimerase component 2 [Lignoscripta atroalba]|nr:Isopenicillin N epimerase component 2 [Lignoscripta atroalba]
MAPLDGLRVIELAGLAPGPFAGLLLADYGASILRIDRPHPSAHSSTTPPPTPDLLVRNKSSIALDLKSVGGLSLLKALLNDADVLIDPFRPGVLESLGLDPNELHTSNQRLIVARLTGFRRDGKYSDMAGHDINYLAVSGVLSQLGRKGGSPYPPANILADFAGGGLMCAFGIITALLAREKTGKGQVVEANMVDGSAYLAEMMRLGKKTPLWNQPRGENILDGGCPWYDVYECKDGGYMAVGALEPQFFTELIEGLRLDKTLLSERNDRAHWPKIRDLFQHTFKTKTRKEWEAVFDGKDACCTAVFEQEELENTGYDQRHPVGLRGTPGIKIDQNQVWTSIGLAPGSGGEDTLHKWMGWQRGKDYVVKGGALVKSVRAKV